MGLLDARFSEEEFSRRFRCSRGKRSTDALSSSDDGTSGKTTERREKDERGWSLLVRGETRKESVTALTARHRDAATGADWTVIAFWVRLIDMGTSGTGGYTELPLKSCLRNGDERSGD